MSFTAMSPEDVRFAALADEYVAAMIAGDTERASRALTPWISEVIKRTSELSIQAARILAEDAVKRAMAPLEERLRALEAGDAG